MDTNVFKGEDPAVGCYTILVADEIQEAVINISKNDGSYHVLEASTAYGTGAVSCVLRQHGFTIDGFQTAQIIPFKRPEVQDGN